MRHRLTDAGESGAGGGLEVPMTMQLLLGRAGDGDDPQPLFQTAHLATWWQGNMDST